MSKGIVSDRRTFYSSLLVLTKVGYISEVKQIIKDTYSSKNDEDVKRMIYNSMSEYESIKNLSDEQIDIVNKCIEMIRESLANEEYELKGNKNKYLKYKKKLEVAEMASFNSFYFYDLSNKKIDRQKYYLQLTSLNI